MTHIVIFYYLDGSVPPELFIYDNDGSLVVLNAAHTAGSEGKMMDIYLLSDGLLKRVFPAKKDKKADELPISPE